MRSRIVMNIVLVSAVLASGLLAGLREMRRQEWRERADQQDE